MSKYLLKRVIPNEQFQVILEFSNLEFRILDMTVLCKEKGWTKLGYPQHMKNFTFSESSAYWPEGGTAEASYLYAKSKTIEKSRLENQVIRLSYKNQAPTSEDKSHHVYGVFLAPFSAKPFRVGESIGGGHGDLGGGHSMSISDLLEWPEWKHHFMLSGCSWATTPIEALAGQPEQLLNSLIIEACKRNGLPEDA